MAELTTLAMELRGGVANAVPMRTESLAGQRAVVLKLTLTTIAEHPRRAQLEAAIPPALRERIELARPSEWLPVEVTMQLLEVMWKQLSRDEFVALYRRQSERSRSDSTIGRLLTGVSSLFMRSPSSRLRHLQRGFDLVQRDLGRMGVVEASESGAVYVVEELPELLRNVCYATSMIAALEFAVGHDTHEVDVKMDTSALERGRVIYRIRWHEHAAGRVQPTL